MKKAAAWLAVHALELNNSAAIGAGLAQPGKEVLPG